MDQKNCCTCRRTLPIEQFHRNKSQGDGRDPRCKECRSREAAERNARPHVKKRRAETARKRYLKKREQILRQTSAYAKTPTGRAVNARCSKAWERTPEARAWRRTWKQMNPEKAKAYSALHTALRSGQIAKPKSCQKCGATGRISGHHHKGYSPEHQLDVEWLCYKCHNNIGKNAA